MKKTTALISRLTAFLLCTVLLLTAFAGWGVVGFAEETAPVVQDVMTKEEAESLLELNDAAYDKICAAVRARQSDVYLNEYDLTTEQVLKLMECVIYNNPEFFYLDTRFSYTSAYVGLSYLYEGQALTDAVAEYESLLDQLCSLGSEEWSDLETVLFYHDYLASHYAYDTDLKIFDAYTFLKTGEGVCQSYALVFDALMSYYDIPCTFAQSKNLNHIWNLVFLDGAWYYLDVTWDDPLAYNKGENVDRPGSAYHEYFLLSAEEDKAAHFTKNNKEVDLFIGAPVTAASSAHPYSSVWKGSTSPFVEAGGHFYGVTVTSNDKGYHESARFVEVNFDKGGQMTGYATLPVYWYVVGSSTNAYPYNYTNLCTDGRYVYYNTDKEVYKYDSQSGRISTVDTSSIDITTAHIYSLRFEGDKLVAYTCSTPDGPFVGVTLENALPEYYLITWMVDTDVFSFYVEEGETPSFPGSPEKEGENGISYQFIGWDPLVVPAYSDATYTAVYVVIKEYLPGDINGDGTISISDVTALLNYISKPDVAEVNLAAIDPNGDGGTSISDVTILLKRIAGEDVELN